MLRIAAATIVGWGLALFLGHVVAAGVRTGKIRRSDPSASVARANRPVAFRALVALHLAFAALLLGVWVKIFSGAAGS